MIYARIKSANKKNPTIVFFFLPVRTNWTVSFFFPPFCSAKTKQNNFLIKLLLHQNIALIHNKRFHLVADAQESNGNEGPAAPLSLPSLPRVSSDGDAFGTWTPGSSPSSAWRGFNVHLLRNELATALCHSLALDRWCFSIYKNVFQSCKYRGNTCWDFFCPDG